MSIAAIEALTLRRRYKFNEMILNITPNIILYRTYFKTHNICITTNDNVYR